MVVSPLHCITLPQFLIEVSEVTGIFPEEFVLFEEKRYYQACTEHMCITCYHRDKIPYHWRFDSLGADGRQYCGYGKTALAASIDLLYSLF